MAKRPSAKAEATEETPGILPVPATVVRHHGGSLFGAMREWKEQGRIPPVLLLTGTPGSGKRHITYWLAQWILCERQGMSAGATASEEDPFTSSPFGDAEPAPAATEVAEPGPCGECASCQRAVRGNWVDFTEILPEDSDTLKVDQFREIKQRLGFGAHQGAYRIVSIPNADRMTVQAANSMLKLLEEPPPGWVFFMTAGDPSLLLPTILSRCQKLRLRPFRPEELDELLEQAGVNPQRRRICADLAQGSWAKALSLASDETWEHRRTLFAFVQEPTSQLGALVDWGAQEPRCFELLVDQLEQVTGELIRWSLSPFVDRPESYPWQNADGKATLSAHASAVASKQGSVTAAREYWMERAERLARARQEALAPLNRKLLIQDLLLPWLEAR